MQPGMELAGVADRTRPTGSTSVAPPAFRQRPQATSAEQPRQMAALGSSANFRLVAVIVGLSVIVGDNPWRHHGRRGGGSRGERASGRRVGNAANRSAPRRPAIARQTVDRGAAVRQSERRGGTGVFFRRHGGGHHYAIVAQRGAVRDRQELWLLVQRPGCPGEPDWARTWCSPCAARQCTPRRRAGADQRPVGGSRDRESSLAAHRGAGPGTCRSFRSYRSAGFDPRADLWPSSLPHARYRCPLSRHS
jgi:hypothetical protein